MDKGDKFFHFVTMLFCFMVFNLGLRWRLKGCGENSVMISPLRVIGTSRISLGCGVRMLHHSRIEAFSTDGHLSIGNDVHIGHNFFCTCAAGISIDSGVLISDNVAIIDNSHIYDPGLSPTDTRLECAKIVIEKNVTIYRNSTILMGVKIGQGSIVAAGSVVRESVAPYTLVAGAPAIPKKSLLGVTKVEP